MPMECTWADENLLRKEGWQVKRNGPNDWKQKDRVNGKQSMISNFVITEDSEQTWGRQMIRSRVTMSHGKIVKNVKEGDGQGNTNQNGDIERSDYSMRMKKDVHKY